MVLDVDLSRFSNVPKINALSFYFITSTLILFHMWPRLQACRCYKQVVARVQTKTDTFVDILSLLHCVPKKVTPKFKSL